jgi:hypothetical protein
MNDSITPERIEEFLFYSIYRNFYKSVVYGLINNYGDEPRCGQHRTHRRGPEKQLDKKATQDQTGTGKEDGDMAVSGI